jgi:hypothetical protein
VPQRPLEEEAFAQFPDDGMVALDGIKAGGLCRRLLFHQDKLA